MTGTTLEGVDELRATLAAAADQLGDLSIPGREAGQAIEDAAQAAAPVLTGELAGSFGLVLDAAGVTVTNSAEHAIPVQFGTRFMAAQPFMPGDLAEVALPAYVEYLDQVLQSIHGK